MRNEENTGTQNCKHSVMTFVTFSKAAVCNHERAQAMWPSKGKFNGND